jgi:membrane-bound lytic murein transglycosylase D
MFATAKGYGLSIDNYVDERRDPIQASYAAAAYFSDAYTELGDWLLAIAAYNCGMGNVNRAISKAGSRDFWEIRRFLPLETRNYVPAFIAAVYVMNYSGNHDIKVLKSGMSEKTDTVQVNRFISLPKLAEALNVDTDALCLLNPSYRKKIVNGTATAPKRLVMPKVDFFKYDLVYNVLNGTETEQPSAPVLISHSSAPVLRYHKVKAGQNLSIIADQYRVEVQDLKVWNKLKSSTIVPGQRLIVGKITEPAEVKDKTGKQFTSAQESLKKKAPKVVENI